LKKKCRPTINRVKNGECALSKGTPGHREKREARCESAEERGKGRVFKRAGSPGRNQFFTNTRVLQMWGEKAGKNLGRKRDVSEKRKKNSSTQLRGKGKGRGALGRPKIEIQAYPKNHRKNLNGPQKKGSPSKKGSKGGQLNLLLRGD